jgi:hypothetical protein
VCGYVRTVTLCDRVTLQICILWNEEPRPNHNNLCNRKPSCILNIPGPTLLDYFYNLDYVSIIS